MAWLNFVFASHPPSFVDLWIIRKRMKIIFHLLLFLFCISYPVVVNAVGSGSNSCLNVLSYFQSIRAPVNAKSMTTIDNSFCQRFGYVLRLRGTKRINEGLRALLKKKKLKNSYDKCMKKYRFPQFCHKVTFGWCYIVVIDGWLYISLPI